MSSNNQLSVLLNLQQIVLDSKDDESLLNTLLNNSIVELSKIGLNYISISVVLVDTSQKITTQYTINQDKTSKSSVKEAFLESDQEIKKTLLENKLAISNKPELFIENLERENSAVKSILLSPIRIMGRLVGIMVFVSDKKSEDIFPSECELIESYTNFVALACRLQNTQASLTDITKEVYKMNAKLHQLDKLKDDFVSIASHELRTPMTAIKSYLWMALNRQKLNLTSDSKQSGASVDQQLTETTANGKPNGSQNLSDDQKRYLNRAYTSVQRLITLVNDMLNISRIEGGRIGLTLSETDLVALSHEVVDELSPKAQEKGLTLQIEDLPIPKVFCDRDKIHEVLINLVGNSLKFTPRGGKITVSFKEQSPYVIATVTDSGRGIAQEDLERLFTKFGRLENSYVAVAESAGTGLGLYISKSLITLHKGTISAESEGLNRGARFIFSLPIAGSGVAENLKIEAPRETKSTKELEKTIVSV